MTCLVGGGKPLFISGKRIGKIYNSKDDVINFSHFYKGLGFIDIIIDPHFDINNSEQYNEALYFSKINPIIGLPNESCVVINDNIKFVGEHYIFDKGDLKNEL